MSVFKNKTKDLLIKDCEYYFDKSHNAEKELRDLRSEISRLNGLIGTVQRKNAALQDSMQHLLEVIKALKNTVGI